MTERTDEELMGDYVRGDPAAFRTLFRRYAPLLLSVMRRHVRSEEDCADLVQQTFLQVHRARADFDTSRRLRPWLFTIALNLKREHFRRTGRRKEDPLELDGRQDPSVPALDLEGSERAMQVRRALEGLPEAQREVIELHWFAGLPFPDIADALGASHTAVKVRAHRGYKRLRAVLEAGHR